VGPGTTVGGFKIDRLLGKGGMGEVYLARQLSMDRNVALKILPSSMTMDEELVQRFLQEVRMVARLAHPHIVTAHEAGEDSGVYYLAMSYVQGQTLADLLTDGGVLEEKDALAITRQMAMALAHAWNKHQMLHRDIKPANIILDEDGEPKLMDMGLCKTLGEQAGMTLSGTVMGTPNYMSPEQAAGQENVDFRTDMYSLGATLYHMLSGHMPFDGSSIMDVLRKQATESLPDPRESNPNVSEACVRLMTVMLAKDPAARHGSWEELTADLDLVSGGKQATAGVPAAGQSVLLRLPSGDTAKPAAAASRKQIVLGQSTIRKLHKRDHVRHPPKKPPPRPASRAPAVALGVTVAVVLLAGAVTALVVSQNKKKAAMRAAIAAHQAASKRVQPPASKPKKPPDVSTKKPTDRKLTAVQKQFDEAVAYAAAHPDNFVECFSRFGKVRTVAQGSALEQKIEQEIARLEQRQRAHIDALMAGLEKKSEELLSQGKQAEALAVLRNYAGKFNSKTRQRREALAAAIEKRAKSAPPPNVAESPPQPPGAEKPAPGQTVAPGMDAITGALLALDFNAARGAIEQAGKTGPKGMDAAAWQELRGLALKVVDMPAVILASFQSDMGKEVTVRLKSGTRKVQITAVEPKKVLAEEIIRSGGKKVGAVARNFTLADLSAQEQFRRLGDETTPDRHIMRGLLAFEGKAEDRAKEFFAKAGAPLGTALLGELQARREKAEAIVRSRERARNEAAVRALYNVMVEVVGFSPKDPPDAIVAVLRKKSLSKAQVTEVKGLMKRLAGMKAKAGDTEFEKEHAAVFKTMDHVRPEMPLEVDLDAVKKAMAALAKANPKEVIQGVPKITETGVVLSLNKHRSVTNITPLAGLPFVDLNLAGTAVADITPLRNMPIRRLDLSKTLVKDLKPLHGMPLVHLNLQHCGQLSDISPLKVAPLKTLIAGQHTRITDLSPLAGMPLQHLDMNYATALSDISPLRGLPLRYLNLHATKVKDLSAVKDIKGLKLQR